MTILEIKKLNEPCLRKKSQVVEKINKEVKEFIISLVQTMEKNQGAGLAAPQVGVLKRIIAVQTDFEGRRILALVNPKILKTGKETEFGEEGCLSFPGIFLKIKRKKEVEVEGLDINGDKIKIAAKGLVARIFQHEIDHLDGVRFFNRLSFFKKIIFKLKHISIKL